MAAFKTTLFLEPPNNVKNVSGMKPNILLIIGIVLIIGGIGGAMVDVDTIWHYLGTGVVAGVGIIITVRAIGRMKRKKQPSENRE